MRNQAQNFEILFMRFFETPCSYLGWIYNLDITKEAEIRHAGSTCKNRIIQWVLNGLIGLVFYLVWLVCFFAAI